MSEGAPKHELQSTGFEVPPQRGAKRVDASGKTALEVVAAERGGRVPVSRAPRRWF
jgi:hypothetical protein